jgi:hypothetical protein
MSMILGLATIRDANLARILSDPPLVWRVIAPDDPEPYEQARRSAPSRSLLARVFGKRASDAEQGALAGLTLEEGQGLSTDLDKSWHGIHYLLTGTAWEGLPPLNFLVAGGREVGTLDVGYGPARVFTAAETRAVRDALSKLGDDDLRARFNAADMMKREIYPGIWDRSPEEDDTLGYLLEYLRILRGYLSQAVDQEHGLVVYLT